MISHRPLNPRSDQAGLTLVEVLVTLAIASIVASFAVVTYSGHSERVRVGDAVAEMQGIQLAIAQYSNRPDRLAHGLPESLDELGLPAEQLIDPWGRPYQYSAQARLNRDYELFSLGPDGLTGSSDSDNPALDDIVRGSSGAFFGARSDYAAMAGTDSGQYSVTGSEAAGSGNAAAGNSALILR